MSTSFPIPVPPDVLITAAVLNFPGSGAVLRLLLVLMRCVHSGDTFVPITVLQEIPGCWLVVMSSPKYYNYWLQHNLELEGCPCLGMTWYILETIRGAAFFDCEELYRRVMTVLLRAFSFGTTYPQGACSIVVVMSVNCSRESRRRSVRNAKTFARHSEICVLV